MRRINLAVATMMGIFLATRMGVAGQEMYWPNACDVDAATNSGSPVQDWFMCVVNQQPPNIRETDWTLDVQFFAFSEPPRNAHFYVEGNPALPIFHMSLGEWIGEPGHFSQCDGLALFWFVTAPGVTRVLRGESAPPGGVTLRYRRSPSDCM